MDSSQTAIQKNRIETEAEDYASEVRRAVKEGHRDPKQMEQEEPAQQLSEHKQPEPPWQID